MLSRLALRIATVESLRPTGAVTWPTAAGSWVFDTLIEPLEHIGPNATQKAICVYTEHDEGKAAQLRGGPPFLMTVDLVLELSVLVKAPTTGDPTVFTVGFPETDPELEAELDLLEAQAKFVLLYGPTGALWRSISHRKVHNPRSAPHRTSEEAARLARRTVTWKVEVQDDCFDPAPLTAPTGLDVLPEPLCSLAKALPAGSYGLKILNGLAAEITAPVMPVAVPLNTVVMSVAIENPVTGTLPATPQIVAEEDNLEN
jgi:hypothetical protein